MVNVAVDPSPQLVSVKGRSMLAVPANLPGFAGEPYEVDGRSVRLVEKNAASAAAVRELLPSLRPRALGTTPSFGFGDRTGLATRGHIRALQSSGSTLAPVLAQQSARELERTGRSFTDVLDAATWGALDSGWTAGYGADADHLRTTGEVEGALAAGFTMFTLDPSAHVNESARSATSADLQRTIDGLPWHVLEDDWQGLKSRYSANEDDLTIGRAAGVFGHALAQVVQLASVLDGATLDIEVSVDEADAPTTPFEHRFLAVELNRLGVAFTSLAPRFPGRWEKALDVDGDLESIAHAIRAHADIAAEHGGYKLSVHSGSDKFSVYAHLVEATGGSLHVKTSGTSYLEALRVIAGTNADLFREILTIAQERFALDRDSYELSPTAHVPSGDGDLEPLLDDPGARQGLHVTFGAVLSHPQIGPALIEALRNAADDYARALESHLGRHLSLLQ